MLMRGAPNAWMSTSLPLRVTFHTVFVRNLWVHSVVEAEVEVCGVCKKQVALVSQLISRDFVIATEMLSIVPLDQVQGVCFAYLLISPRLGVGVIGKHIPPPVMSGCHLAMNVQWPPPV